MAKIQNIIAREILGFKGKPTIEVVVEDESGRSAKAKLAFGVSEGKLEAIYLTPQQAQEKCQSEVLPILKGLAVEDVLAVERRLLELDPSFQKEKLGGNLILGIGLATARLAAAEQNISFYRYLAYLLQGNQEFIYQPPRLLCNLVEGGAHADNSLEFQEHLLIPQSGQVRNSLEVIRRYAAAFFSEMQTGRKTMVFGDEGGWAGDYESEEGLVKLLDELRQRTGVYLDLGFDIAANNIPSFEPKLYLSRYLKLRSDFDILYFEDPFPEEGFEGYYQELSGALGSGVLVAGDDLTVTNPVQLKRFAGRNMINAVIIKPDQVGSLTETLEAVKIARQNNWKIIVSHRAQETTDDYLADLAIGLGADFVKFGYLYQGERLAKYNRLLEIEEAETGK